MKCTLCVCVCGGYPALSVHIGYFVRLKAHGIVKKLFGASF